MNWQQATIVGFDIETSGAYPLADEICEIAAVKWQNGKIIDTLQSLVAVQRPISERIIKIHNITNEMLVGAPAVADVIRRFVKFIDGAYLVAHHAPFDMGFITVELEKQKISLPSNKVFCSSLLSRKAFSDAPNHKLQTLIEYFKLTKGQAHRAQDDAEACLQIALKVFEKVTAQKGSECLIDDLLLYQGTELTWQKYSIADLRAHEVFRYLVEAVCSRTPLQIVYTGGSRPGEARTVLPIGLVRNPQGDYLVAHDEGRTDEQPKRYYLNKISAARL